MSDLLDLPNDEMTVLCKALSPATVSYAPGTAAKRIARGISGAEVSALSAKQRNAAIRIAYRYRRQMPNSVIAILSRWPESILKDAG